MNSSELSAFKKYSNEFIPWEQQIQNKGKGDNKEAETEVKYCRPLHVKTFPDFVVKVDIASRHQIIIQTVYEVFVYRCSPDRGLLMDSFGHGRLELTVPCALRYTHCLDFSGHVKMLAIAVDKGDLRADTVEFSGREENYCSRRIRVYHSSNG